MAAPLHAGERTAHASSPRCTTAPTARPTRFARYVIDARLARRCRRSTPARARGAGRRRRRRSRDVVVPVRHRPRRHDDRQRPTGRRPAALAAPRSSSPARPAAARPPLGARGRRRAARCRLARTAPTTRSCSSCSTSSDPRTAGPGSSTAAPTAPRARAPTAPATCAVGRRPRRALPRWRAGVDARRGRSRARAHHRRGRAGRPPLPRAPVTLVHHALLRHASAERRLQLRDGVDGPGVDVVVEREVVAGPVADVDRGRGAGPAGPRPRPRR